MLVMLALATHVTTARADGNTITQTAITSPSDPSFFYDPSGGGIDPSTHDALGFTVTGTTNSTDTAHDTVDIDCYHDDGSSGSEEDRLVSGVQLDASGGFSTTVPYEAMEQYGDPCELRAVPAGTYPSTGLASFAGPRVLLAYLEMGWDYTNGEAIADYHLFAPQLGAADNYWSFGDCGLTDSYLYDQSVFGQEDGTGFHCNDYTNADNGQGNIEVDGQQAYLPWDTAGAEQPGQGGITISATQNPSNGDMTIHELNPIGLCTDAPCGTPYEPPNYDDNNDYVSSGVEDQRTITQTDNGHIVYIDDRYVSTDGASHQVTLDLVNDQYFNGGDLEYELPGQSTFTATPDTLNWEPVSGPASIFLENADQADGSTGAVRGAITYFTTPSGRLSFPGAPGDDSYFTVPYTLTVPAGGSVSLDFAYSTEFSLAAAQQDTQTALDLHSPPAVAITSPAGGTTVSTGSVTVSGTASAGSGVKSVTVNGVSATLNGSGFSAVVPLTTGSNTLKATVTSDAGGSASSSSTVTYTPNSVVVPKKLPQRLGLTVKPGRDRKAPYRFAFSGKLQLPSGVSPASGCTGTVTLRFRHGRNTVLVRYARIGANCKYSGSASFSKRKLAGTGKLSIGATFGGNSALESRSARAVTVAYGHRRRGSAARAASEGANVEVTQ